MCVGGGWVNVCVCWCVCVCVCFREREREREDHSLSLNNEIVHAVCVNLFRVTLIMNHV